MRILFATFALAVVALPSAAFAADGEMEKCCCCEKMKHEGADCCDKDSKGDAPDHGDHAQQADPQPDAPAQ